MVYRVWTYQGADGKFYWRAISRNHKEIGASEQGYRSRWWAKQKAKWAYPGIEVEKR